MVVVLIVEDSDNIAPLEIALSSLKGARTVIVHDGREALRVARALAGELAAIVTDLNLPLVDGFELIAAVRKEERFNKLPIVVVSGDNKPENRLRVRELGANAFFAKPYSPSEIRDTLEGLLYVS
jgi:two-component system, chemotaxis family, chemotaxis protein CheY